MVAGLWGLSLMTRLAHGRRDIFQFGYRVSVKTELEEKIGGRTEANASGREHASFSRVYTVELPWD